MKFEHFAGGMHRSGDQQTTVGDTIEVDTDLAKSFPDKFRQIPDVPAVMNVPIPATEAESGEPANEELDDAEPPILLDDDDETEDDRGTLVTDRFQPAAGELGVDVFKQGKNYSVYDTDDPENALNTDRLKNQDEVRVFLKEF